jgi:putative transposase
MKKIHPVALFRLSVLGPLASRERLDHGELKRLL